MSKLLPRFRAVALLILAGLSLSACLSMGGEAVYTSTISVEFPGTSKEAALQLALDTARDQGYRRRTIRLLAGKSVDETCPYNSAEYKTCRDDFFVRAEQLEAPIEKIADRPETWESEDSLRVWTEKIEKSSGSTTTPTITAIQHRSGSEVRFSFSSFIGEMNEERRGNFYRLKQVLIDRWGDMVSTEDEPDEIEP